MTQRFRLEAPTLKALIEHDELLVGQCELLRSKLDGQNGITILQNLGDLQSGTAAIRETLRQREAVLHERV